MTGITSVMGVSLLDRSYTVVLTVPAFSVGSSARVRAGRAWALVPGWSPGSSGLLWNVGLRRYRRRVTAAESAPVPERPPFAAASPAQVRAALTAEDVVEFDRQWRDVMERATRELDLTEVQQTLTRWRRVAWVTSATGAERYRAVLADAGNRLRTGERHPRAVPWAQLKVELGLPE